MKQKVYPYIGYLSELGEAERRKLREIRRKIKNKYNLQYTSYTNGGLGNEDELIEVELPEEGCAIEDFVKIKIPIEPLTEEDFAVVYANVKKENYGCEVVLRKTERVVKQVEAKKEEILWKIIRSLKSDLETKEMWEREYSPKTPGNIPWSYKNYKILLSALDRMSRREMRNFYPPALYVDRGLLKVSKYYLRVYRRMVDFVAHAASSGWLELEWNPADILIKGENLYFYNGKLAYPQEFGQVPIILINI